MVVELNKILYDFGIRRISRKNKYTKKISVIRSVFRTFFVFGVSVTSIFLLAASLGLLGFGLGANAAIFMKVVLSGISMKKAGAATGTYGLFRDLAAPFGVAVFVPLFTNQVTANVSMGLDEISAAVRSIRLLALTEVVGVAAGLIVVVLLPEIHKRKEIINETEG